MPSPLENLAGPGGMLHRQPPDAREIAGLLRAGRERLADAKVRQFARRKVHAGLRCGPFAVPRRAATAGLPSRQSLRGPQALPHTLGLDVPTWRLLARAHTMRNESEYHGRLEVSEKFVSELIAAVESVLAALDALPPIA